MKKIIHLSDLHFGTERPGLVDLLINDCKQANADLIVVSGDITQRATHAQYRDAKMFLDHFKNIEILSVPGNHDISLYNPIERFCYPFAKYKKWISSNLCVHKMQDNIALLGINSVTPYKPMGGYVTDKQLQLVTDYFKSQADDTIRIIVMHHNLMKSDRHEIINDAENILKVFAAARVNLVLSGHIHFAAIEKIKKDFVKNNFYLITAGTAISNRTSAPNSYNIIEIKDGEFTLMVRSVIEGRFDTTSEMSYSL